jgi:hypothetical protein
MRENGEQKEKEQGIFHREVMLKPTLGFRSDDSFSEIQKN